MDQGWQAKNLPIEVTAQLYGSTGSAGFVIRTQHDANDPYNKPEGEHYRVVLDWSQRRVRVQRRAAGELRSPLCNSQFSSSIVRSNVWQTLYVLAEGNRIQVYLDGTRRCDVRDTAADALPAGGAGLFSDSPGAAPRFRDLKIRHIDDECKNGCDEMAAGETCEFTC